MKRFVVITVSSIALMLSISAMAQSFTRTVEINGFSDGSASIESGITAQIVTKVAAPIKTMLSHAPNDKVVITIVGCASQSGTDATNYKIGKARADAVGSVLLEQLPQEAFPGVTINYPRSNGSEARARIVQVKLEVFPAHPATPRPHQKEMVGIGVVAVALLVIVIVALTRTFTTRAHAPEIIPQETPASNLVVMPLKKTKRQKRVVTEDGREYLVTFFQYDGPRGFGWYTPFPPKNDFRQNFGKAQGAAKDALENLSEPEIKQLISEAYVSEIQTKKGGA